MAPREPEVGPAVAQHEGRQLQCAGGLRTTACAGGRFGPLHEVQPHASRQALVMVGHPLHLLSLLTVHSVGPWFFVVDCVRCARAVVVCTKSNVLLASCEWSHLDTQSSGHEEEEGEQERSSSLPG